MNSKYGLLAVVTFVITAIAAPLQVLSWPVMALVVFLIGAGAGWSAAQAGEERRAARAIGWAAFLGSVAGILVAAVVLGSIPGVQQFVQASEPHPEARIPTGLIPIAAGASGLIAGVVLGLMNLVVAYAGVYLTAMLRRRNVAVTK